MPLADRDYMREKHPPACTCVRCEQERMKGYRRYAALSQKPLWKRLLGKVIPWVR